ncbi:class II fructose-bisphosphate aldolase [Actinomyces glycerinitolerans]|uniref:Ketose-bisphosphate aldolase class-ii n=1 Tax=Actinomyces glycerinitolerans TaxID=1892869 RepID=A0A1M4RWX5_9ACTO|nr:class II fructose-bisphosphate aldolase [Actinomyces glycerinitolerans]SHE24473.1 ketose-bisphosphate aldolase class-ii [Actinomyces glycerinitolerans]
MLADLAWWLRHAQANGYAIPHFNTWNAEMLMGVMDAAEETRSPVIISFGTSFTGNVVFEEFAWLMRNMAEHANVPTIVHWDHGRSFDIVHNAYVHGNNAIMRDASKLPFEENVAETKRVVDYFHPRGVPVEAELGHVGDYGDYEEVLAHYQYTDPAQAAEFVERTGCDALAVAIGNIHGPYSSPPRIAHDVLEAVREAVDIPLVLHGASGIPDDDVRRAIANGVAKVNIHSELGEAAMAAIVKDTSTNYVNTQLRVRAALKQRALEKIELLGSAGHADAMPVVAGDLNRVTDGRAPTPEGLKAQ